MNNQFNELYLNGSFELSPMDEYLYCLAMEYHTRTEAYDQRVCRARHNGVAIPTNSHESGLINRNAREVLHDLCNRYQVDKDQLIKAIQKHSPNV